MSTIGTDPEFFVRRGDEIIPVCGLLGGTKAEPRPLPNLPNGFGVQEDNVMAELTVPAALSPDAFRDNVQAGMEAIRALLWDHDCSLVDNTCEHLFPGNMLTGAQAREFGCSPDFMAYDMGRQRPRINPDMVGDHRFCGGHVHLGGDFNCPPHIAAMFADAVLGTWSIIAGDPQRERRRWYGRAGIYRPKEYGIEYRVMSNFWTSNPETMEDMAYNAYALSRFLERDAEEIRAAFMTFNWGDVRRCIDENNRTVASAVYDIAQGVVRT